MTFNRILVIIVTIMIFPSISFSQLNNIKNTFSIFEMTLEDASVKLAEMNFTHQSSGNIGNPKFFKPDHTFEYNNEEERIRLSCTDQNNQEIYKIEIFTLLAYKLIPYKNQVNAISENDKQMFSFEMHQTKYASFITITPTAAFYQRKKVSMVYPNMEFYANGKIRYKGAIVNGAADGQWIFYYENGSISGVVSYKNGKLNGEGKFYYEDGTFKESVNYIYDLKEGLDILYYPNGVIKESSYYKNGKLNGQATRYYENGTVKFITNFIEDLKNGTSISYYPNGKKQIELNFENDVANGKQTTYYENGTIKVEAYFVNGKKEGKWIYYDENGKKVKMLVHENDVVIKER